MSKHGNNNNNFQERFKNRTENVGKDGMAGIMRVTDKPINSNVDIQQSNLDNWNNIFDTGKFFIL